MSAAYIILGFVGILIVLPIVSYMVVKFGAAGYFQARRRAAKQTKDKQNE